MKIFLARTHTLNKFYIINEKIYKSKTINPKHIRGYEYGDTIMEFEKGSLIFKFTNEQNKQKIKINVTGDPIKIALLREDIINSKYPTHSDPDPYFTGF